MTGHPLPATEFLVYMADAIMQTPWRTMAYVRSGLPVKRNVVAATEIPQGMTMTKEGWGQVGMS